jgi:alkylation response protein AidB-like acyl-CoA dehydrogenase
LAVLLAQGAGLARAKEIACALQDFGGVVATVIDPAVASLERRRELPALVAYDGVGRRIDRIEFHPDYELIGRQVWKAGLLAINRGGQRAYEQAALFYLLAHAGEGGHACPVVCTAGLARAVERRGSRELRDKYLDGLFEADYDVCERGSQFLTEVQGGSDVGANETYAVPDEHVVGAWRIYGEKWFCSVADADLFAITARPPGAAGGTRGLGCFVVPRTVDGDSGPNGFRIRRLKDKFGTRAMASAEIDFDGALAWPIGDIADGFHVAVEELLNTSRWLNAVGSAGIMARAYLEASSYARHRTAFGHVIIEYPLIRSQLAKMMVTEHAALAQCLVLAGLIERIDNDTASEQERAAHRVLVNANKLVTSLDASAVVHGAIEILGGNGTIEDFSPLPRLYRDAMVFESWEGSHNVLCAQVLRDFGRGRTFAAFDEWLTMEISLGLGELAARVMESWIELRPMVRASVANPNESSVGFRDQLTKIVRLAQAAALNRAASQDLETMRPVAELFAATYLFDLSTGCADSDLGLVDRVISQGLRS